MVYESLAAYTRAFAQDFADRCTLCGDCLRVCPAFEHSVFRDEDPSQVREKFIRFIEDRSYAREVGAFLDVCIRCGMCAAACPQDLNVLDLHDLIKPWVKAEGFLSGSAFTPFLPGARYNLLKVLGAIQTRPSEKRWLTRLPENPKRTKIVFYTSCGGAAFPDRTAPQIDILERMGVDFVALGSFEIGACCGVVNMVGAGSHEMAEACARDLVSKFEIFQPETVIAVCPHCVVWLQRHVPHFRPFSFRVQDYYSFLSDHLGGLDFKPLPITVTVHDHCPIARPVDHSGYLRNIFRAIPGLRVREMTRVGKNAPCCGENLPPELKDLGKRMRRERLQEAVATGAEVLATACPACDHNYSIESADYNIRVRNIIPILMESLGIPSYENKLERFRSYRDIDRVLKEASATIVENGFTPEELREPLSHFLWGMR